MHELEYSFYDTGAIRYTELFLSDALEYGLIADGTIYIYYDEPSDNDRLSYAQSFEKNVETGKFELTDTASVLYDDNWNISEYKQQYLTSYSYDKNGNITEEIYTYDTNNTRVINYKYDKYNVLVSSSKIDRYEDKYYRDNYKYKYDYDENGLPKVKYKYCSGELVSTTKISRNNDNLIVREEETDSDGKKTITEYERCLRKNYKYDESKDHSDTNEDGSVTQNSNSTSTAVQKARDFFSDKVGEYQDTAIPGTVFILEEEPEEANNYANYSIAGRAFSGIYDSNCVYANADTYIFDDIYGGYYKIEEKNGIITIYIGSTQDDCNDVAGRFELAKGQSNEPFWGIWCSASENYEDAESMVNTLNGYGFDAKIVLTSDWDNLNSKLYYAVTVGEYATEQEAKNRLNDVKVYIPGAYVKYSGNHKW